GCARSWVRRTEAAPGAYTCASVLVLAAVANLTAHGSAARGATILKQQLRLGTFTSRSYVIPADAEIIRVVLMTSDEDVLDPEHYLRMHFEFTPSANVGDHFHWG